MPPPEIVQFPVLHDERAIHSLRFPDAALSVS